MSSLTELTLALFLGLALVGALAGVSAWVVSKALLRRRLRAEAAGTARPGGWGGRDHERVRSKYFEKERRARAQRARRRSQPAPPGATPPDERTPGPVNLERLHRETLGLEGEVTPEAVRAAFKARIREYHPDRVARLGAKLVRLAEEETKRINEAYRYFRERYGF